MKERRKRVLTNWGAQREGRLRIWKEIDERIGLTFWGIRIKGSVRTLKESVQVRVTDQLRTYRTSSQNTT